MIASFVFCKEIKNLVIFLRNKDYKSLKLFACVFSLMICCALLLINCSRMKRGIYLPFERQQQLESITGNIDQFERDRFSPRFSLTIGSEETYSYGGIVVIDGEAYYCLSYHNWRDGDNVSILYLPKSRIILRCEKHE